jgi:hypothetical protein
MFASLPSTPDTEEQMHWQAGTPERGAVRGRELAVLHYEEKANV